MAIGIIKYYKYNAKYRKFWKYRINLNKNMGYRYKETGLKV